MIRPCVLIVGALILATTPPSVLCARRKVDVNASEASDAETENLCSEQKSCTSCASVEDVSCRWCAKDNKCHAPGALLTNACTFTENIADANLCKENCKVKDPAKKCKGGHCRKEYECGWYLEKTGSSNPAEWKGGDFLPVQYGTAAVCACSGGYPQGAASGEDEGNVLWKQAAPQCVRTYLYHHHADLTPEQKKDFYDNTWTQKTVKFFYKMHVDAYKHCGCVGKPAPYITWWGIFIGGNLLPCQTRIAKTPGSSILSSILAFGRCGCGW